MISNRVDRLLEAISRFLARTTRRRLRYSAPPKPPGTSQVDAGGATTELSRSGLAVAKSQESLPPPPPSETVERCEQAASAETPRRRPWSANLDYLERPLADEVADALDVFAAFPWCFNVKEVVDWIHSDAAWQAVEQALCTDRRFLRLNSQTSSDCLFVPSMALLRWWCYLSVRLANAEVARLGEVQLAMAMSSLHPSGRWDTPPPEAIRYGQSLGFVAPALTPGVYVFPMAQVLRWCPLRGSAKYRILRTLGEEVQLLFAGELVHQLLSGFDKRNVHVMLSREGLITGRSRTLQDIGLELGITRERVRQIEEKFWKRVRHPSWRRKFMGAFIGYVAHSHGNLLVRAGSSEAPFLRLLAKCAGVSEVELPTGDVVLCASEGDFAVLNADALLGATDAEAVARTLESGGHLCLSGADLKAIAESFSHFARKKLDKGERVYLALRTLGRRAHYSEITRTYNTLFPEDESSEHSIHAVLGREQDGVVWVGVRGTYALKEWGYERPSKGLYEAACEIVEKKFAETRKPVPFEVIAAEMGKYRQVVNANSLVLATHCNPKLRRVSGNSFIPQENGGDQPELTADELDGILRNFEKREELAQSE